MVQSSWSTAETSSEKCRYLSACPFLPPMSNEMYPYFLRPPLIYEVLSTFSRRHFHIFSLFSNANNGANKAWHYIWTVCWADDSHEKFSLFAVKYRKQIGICSKIFSSAPGVQAVFLAAAAHAHLENNEWKAGISALGREAWNNKIVWKGTFLLLKWHGEKWASLNIEFVRFRGKRDCRHLYVLLRFFRDRVEYVRRTTKTLTRLCRLFRGLLLGRIKLQLKHYKITHYFVVYLCSERNIISQL